MGQGRCCAWSVMVNGTRSWNPFRRPTPIQRGPTTFRRRMHAIRIATSSALHACFLTRSSVAIRRPIRPSQSLQLCMHTSDCRAILDRASPRGNNYSTMLEAIATSGGRCGTAWRWSARRAEVYRLIVYRAPTRSAMARKVAAITAPILCELDSFQYQTPSSASPGGPLMGQPTGWRGRIRTRTHSREHLGHLGTRAHNDARAPTATAFTAAVIEKAFRPIPLGFVLSLCGAGHDHAIVEQGALRGR